MQKPAVTFFKTDFTPPRLHFGTDALCRTLHDVSTVNSTVRSTEMAKNNP
jgi:hypothetical protein